jgi:hypothetical protein
MSQGMIPPTRSAAPVLAIGGVCGLAWAAGLRGFMAELAGSASDVGWYDTFAQILLPGVIASVLLGWAEHIRRTGGRRGWRWLAAAPIVFTVAVFVSPEVFQAVLNGQPRAALTSAARNRRSGVLCGESAAPFWDRSM